MGFVRRIIRAASSPIRALRWRRGDSGSDRPASLSGAAIAYAGVARTVFAPWWRKLIRWSVVITGLVLFAGMQYGMAVLINRWWWWFIIAFFVIAGSIALASFRPILVFVAWLVISPFGRHFLYMDFGWLAFPALTFDLIAIYFLAVVLVFRALANRKPVGKLLFAEWLMLLFVVYVAATQAVSPENKTFMDIVRTTSRTLIPEVLILSVLYFVTKGVIQKKEHAALILKSMILFGLLMAVVAFYEHYTGNRWYSLVVGFGIPLAWQGIAEGRASGMFDHAAAPAALIATTFLLSYHLAGWTRAAHVRAMYYGIMVLMIVGAFFTYTRNVYVVLMLTVLLMPFAASVKRGRFVALSVLGFVLLVVIAPFLLRDQDLYNRVTDLKNAEARVVYARTTINVIRHNLWFGVGWGNVNKAHKEYVTSLRHHNYKPDSRRLGWVNISHNSYLTVMAEQGLVGSVLYFGAIAAFMGRLLRIRKRIPAEGLVGRDLVSIVIVSSVGFLTSIVAASIYLIPYVNWIFWMQFALVVRLDELNRQESEERAEVPARQMAAIPAAAG